MQNSYLRLSLKISQSQYRNRREEEHGKRVTLATKYKYCEARQSNKLLNRDEGGLSVEIYRHYVMSFVSQALREVIRLVA